MTAKAFNCPEHELLKLRHAGPLAWCESCGYEAPESRAVPMNVALRAAALFQPGPEPLTPARWLSDEFEAGRAVGPARLAYRFRLPREDAERIFYAWLNR